MAKALKKNATYADLYEVPEHFVAEIIGGELYASPQPAYPHAFATSVLGAKIGGPFQFGINGPGGWLTLDKPELRLKDDVLVPDIAAWRRERLLAVKRKDGGAATRLGKLVAAGLAKPPSEQGDPTEGWPTLRLPAGSAEALIDAERGD